jgi:hypothetical protein
MTRVLLTTFAVLLAGLAGSAPAAEREACWSGWGYRVTPETFAFRSGRILLATDGPADWVPGERIVLYPLDPRTGQRAPERAPIAVRPRRPSFGHARGNRTVDDVAAIVGSDLRLMLGMTRIGPGSAPGSRAFLDWACGQAAQ